MAIEYDLEMVSCLEPQQALALLIDKCGFQWGPDQSEVPQIWEYGLWVPAMKSMKISQKIYEEAFGFRPTLTIVFRIQTNDRVPAYKAIYRAVITLLTHESGDAVLSDDDHVSLQRIGGELLINNDPNPRYMEMILSEITLPYQLAVLPQPMFGDRG